LSLPLLLTHISIHVSQKRERVERENSLRE
jgi:hypothetical protein